MLSTDEVYHATLFMRSYKDALSTVEQIAEKRNTYNHYKEFLSDLSEGMKNVEVILRQDGVKGTSTEKPFKYLKMWKHTKSLFESYKFATVKSYKQFNTLLDKAIDDLSKKVPPQIQEFP
eukprot:TRINITY_DN67_c0_g4_i1.p1 TRINITY_DN67_c0_g4~~TRINITY_DN67_c0_g4_i1.p1  ORF type:complete len:120 (+),score=15.03 TRINITY_DN67_c0_g4_i1:116-475(+)